MINLRKRYLIKHCRAIRIALLKNLKNNSPNISFLITIHNNNKRTKLLCSNLVKSWIRTRLRSISISTRTSRIRKKMRNSFRLTRAISKARTRTTKAKVLNKGTSISSYMRRTRRLTVVEMIRENMIRTIEHSGSLSNRKLKDYLIWRIKHLI